MIDENMIVLARLVGYVRDEALKRISDAGKREKLRAHANAMVKLLEVKK